MSPRKKKMRNDSESDGDDESAPHRNSYHIMGKYGKGKLW